MSAARFAKTVLLFVFFCLFVTPRVHAQDAAQAAAPSAAFDMSNGELLVGVEAPGAAGDNFDPSAFDLHVGERITRASLRQSIERITRSGRFADVAFSMRRADDGVVLIVELIPRLLLARLVINGNEALADDEVSRALQVGPGDPIDDATLADLSRRVTELYNERGYPSARVTFERRDTNDPTRKVLILTIAEGQALRIARVVFDGDAPVKPFDEIAVNELDLDEDDILVRREVQEHLHALELRLRNEGFLEAAFSDWSYDRDDDGRAVVHIRCETGPRYEVLLTGHLPVPRESVSSAIVNIEERLSRGSAPRTIRERVTQVFRKHGFLDASAEVRIQLSEAERRARMHVVVAHGPQVRVVDLTFAGHDHFDESLLRDQIVAYLEDDIDGVRLLYPVDADVVNRVAGGLPTTEARQERAPLLVVPGEVFYEATYLEAIEHIKELYQSDGFLSAEVDPPRVERLDDHRLRVVIAVREGPQTHVRGVSFEGNAALSSQELAEHLNLEDDQAFSHLALEEARIRLVDAYREIGYFYASVEPVTHFSEDRTRASILFQVNERFPVRISEIVIRGLGTTMESVVRGVMLMTEGDLYKPSTARTSEERLLELGIFSGVSIVPEDESLPARDKRIIVTLSERQTQYLEGTAGLSTGQGGRAGFEYGVRNAFGTAIGLSLRAQFAYQFFFVEPGLEARFDALNTADRLGRRITATITVPYIPELRNLRSSLNIVHIRANERDFGYDKNGVILTFNYTPWRRLSFTLSEELENNNVGLFVADNLAALQQMTTDPRLQKLLRVPQGESTLLATRATISLDYRDSPFVPTRGFFASIAGEWARTVYTERLSDGDQFFSNFIKLSLTTSGYIPIYPGVVFALQARFGYIVHLDENSKTYPNRQFFLGGVDTMRGYPQDAMVPQEFASAIARGEATPNAILRGGDTFLLFRAELRFPLIGPLQGGIFTDIGNLWADVSNINPFDLRPTAGLGIRIATPVGPIAFDYGFILDRRRVPLAVDGNGFALSRPYEPVGSFHFSIGLF